MDPTTGQALTFQEAMDCGVLDASKSSVIVPGSGETLDLDVAIQQGIFDPKSGKLYDPGMLLFSVYRFVAIYALNSCIVMLMG